MTRFSTIVFDFDGTLVDSLDSVVDDVNRVVKGFGRRPLTEEWIERTISGGANSFFNRFKAFRKLTNKLISLVQREQKKHLGELEPVPRLIAVLLLLKKRGYSLGIVSSNTVENITNYLKDQGWEGIFEFVYAGGEVGNKSELIKQMLLERKLTCANVIYVGDEPRDVVAARDAGVAAIGVTWGFQPKEAFTEVDPRWLIDSPKELLIICPEKLWWQRMILNLIKR